MAAASQRPRRERSCDGPHQLRLRSPTESRGSTIPLWKDSACSETCALPDTDRDLLVVRVPGMEGHLEVGPQIVVGSDYWGTTASRSRSSYYAPQSPPPSPPAPKQTQDQVSKSAAIFEGFPGAIKCACYCGLGTGIVLCLVQVHAAWISVVAIRVLAVIGAMVGAGIGYAFAYGRVMGSEVTDPPTKPLASSRLVDPIERPWTLKRPGVTTSTTSRVCGVHRKTVFCANLSPAPNTWSRFASTKSSPRKRGATSAQTHRQPATVDASAHHRDPRTR